MRTRTTLILLLVVAAVAAWIGLVEKKRPGTDEARHLAGTLLDIERQDIEGIVIRSGDEKIELRRTGDRWRVEAPINDQADEGAVENLLSALSNWQRDQTFSKEEIAKDEERLTEYDLVKPKLRLKLLGKEAPPEILFGREAALEGRMYVRFEDSKEVYLVRDTVRDAITKKPEDFRDHTLTDIGVAQVERIKLDTPAGQMELEKTEGEWQIVKPLRARADAQKVNDLIAQVATARIEQFVADDTGDLQPYGLAQPRGAVTLFTRGNQEGRVLQIGATPEKQQDQVYVRFSPRKFVYTVGRKVESILNTTPAELRDRSLVRFDENMLDRITIDAPGRAQTVLARKDDQWVIANAENQPANAAEVKRLLETLRTAQVTRFVEDVASDLAKYGLDQPQLRVTLSSFASENTAESEAGERPMASVAFGRAEGEEIFARSGDDPFIVAVKRDLLEKIPPDPLQWQELSVFRAKPEEVQRVTVQKQETQTLARGAANEWQWADNTGQGPIDATNVQSLVNTLATLRAVRWVGGEPPGAAFDQPQATITWSTGAEPGQTHTLVVGGSAGNGMWYGRVEGRPGVFVLNNPDVSALLLPLIPAAPELAASPAEASPSGSPAAEASPAAAPTP